MDLTPLSAPPPTILARRRRDLTRFFAVDDLDLRFSNGREQTFTRLVGGCGAVLAVPYDGRDFYLIAEYACGTEAYELGLVKGKIDAGETPEQAVGRELREEIGYAAGRVARLRETMPVEPYMMQLTLYPFLCTDLRWDPADTGDEPEPLRLVKLSPGDVRAMLTDPAAPLREARAIACLALALCRLRI